MATPITLPVVRIERMGGCQTLADAANLLRARANQVAGGKAFDRPSTAFEMRDIAMLLDEIADMAKDTMVSDAGFGEYVRSIVPI
jgi:hypothetical protein